MPKTKKNILPPEGAVYTGGKGPPGVELSVITYDSAGAEIKRLSGTGELARYTGGSKTLWINVSGLRDTAAIKQLGAMFNIHPLSIEDILNTGQQPKIEMFGNYRFFSIKTIRQGEKPGGGKKKHPLFFRKKNGTAEEPDELLIDQISMIIMENTLITFQEIPGGSFDGIRKKILDDTGEIRKAGTDYLAYTVIDSAVDEYYLALNRMEEEIEGFEDRAAEPTDETFIGQIQDTKKHLSRIRQAVLPLKENLNSISRTGNFFNSAELKPFMQDLEEHLNHTLLIVENYREWLTNIMNMNISVLTYHMNKVMKVLAMISTIFIPLTFIAGIYGMNFDYMPELRYQLGYPAVLGGMGIIAAVMIILFKIRRWF